MGRAQPDGPNQPAEMEVARTGWGGLGVERQAALPASLVGADHLMLGGVSSLVPGYPDTCNGGADTRIASSGQGS